MDSKWEIEAEKVTDTKMEGFSHRKIIYLRVANHRQLASTVHAQWSVFKVQRTEDGCPSSPQQ